MCIYSPHCNGSVYCTCPRRKPPTPPPTSCAEGARLRSELASAWAENYRLRNAPPVVRITHTADEQSKATRRKLDCLEAAAVAALIVAAAAAAACIKWLVS